MQRLLVMMNRHALDCKPELLIHQIRRGIWGYDLEFCAMSSVEDGSQAIVGLDPAIYKAIVVAGGDGTVNRLLPFLIQKKIPIYVLPTGTANDFAAHLGFDYDLQRMQSVLDHGQCHGVDIITVNGNPYVTTGGIGIGGMLTSTVNQMKNQSALFRLATRIVKHDIYSLAVVETVIAHSSYNHNVRLICGGESHQYRVCTVIVTNQPQFAGRMSFTKNSQNDDGIFEVLVVMAVGKVEIAKALLDLRKGEKPPATVIFRTDQLVIEDLNKRNISGFGDGEDWQLGPRVEFKMLQGALPVFRRVESEDQRTKYKESRAV